MASSRCAWAVGAGVSHDRVVSAQTSIGADVEGYVRHYLARTQPKAYARDKARLAISADHLKFADNSHLGFDVDVEVPKDDGIAFAGHLTLALYPAHNVLRTRLMGIKAGS